RLLLRWRRQWCRGQAEDHQRHAPRQRPDPKGAHEWKPPAGIDSTRIGWGENERGHCSLADGARTDKQSQQTACDAGDWTKLAGGSARAARPRGSPEGRILRGWSPASRAAFRLVTRIHPVAVSTPSPRQRAELQDG